MIATSIFAATPWLALPLMLAVLAACCVAVFARSLLVACICMVAAGAVATAILPLLSAGAAAPELALLGVAWAPLLLVGATLLSKRAARARQRRPWLGLTWGAFAAAALTWVVLSDAPSAATPVQFGQSNSGLWFAPLFLALGIAAMAMAGFGERGALEQAKEPL